ncbi:MAG: hypothetical protein OXH50_13075 [Gemmatimonadetes bacterium]|nr:hypothetical protein [Gemmatimonadota bacterium]
MRWFAAIVDADVPGDWQLHAGAASDFTASAWVNGEPVLTGVREPASSGTVRLQAGRNEMVLRILHPGGARVRAWAAFSTPGHPPPGDPYVPLLRWFRDPPPLLFDVTPGARRAGWFRLRCPARARRHADAAVRPPPRGLGRRRTGLLPGHRLRPAGAGPRADREPPDTASGVRT